MRTPFPIRLMSLVVYLPIMLTLFVVPSLFTGLTWETVHHTYWGVLSIYQWMWVVFAVCPVLAGLLLLWKGALRVGFVLMVAPALLYIPIGSISPPKGNLAPEKRAIIIGSDTLFSRGGLPSGTDVYCNGVLLGQTPLKITVEELLQKVQPWTTPPPQKWLDAKPFKFYSWFPWDGFLRERWTGHIGNVADLNIHNSQYWWRFEFQGSELCCFGGGYEATGSFAHVVSYRELLYKDYFAPSVIPHVDLLLNVYPQLDEADKKLWTKHALEHFDLLSPWIFNRMTPEAKEAVASLHYGLSETPSTSECRAALEQIVRECKNTGNYRTNYYGNTRFSFGKSFDKHGVTRAATLGPIAMERMGSAAVGPLEQLLRAHRYEMYETPEPLLFAAQTQNDPELFDELVRYLAVTQTSSLAVWKNRNENVAPLFETLYHQSMMADLVNRANSDYHYWRYIWPETMSELFTYYNPLTEPFLRRQMEEEFPKLRQKGFSSTADDVCGDYVRARWDIEGIDREELLQWVGAVSGRPADSVESQRFFVEQKAVSYPHFQGRIGLLFQRENKAPAASAMLTFEQVAQWLENNPGKNVIAYFADFDNDTARANTVLMMQALFFQEFFESPAESAKMLQDSWTDPEMKRIVLAALARQFVEELRIQWDWNRRQREEQRRNPRYYPYYDYSDERDGVRVRLPGVYGTYDDLYDTSREVERPLQFSAALYPIFQEISDLDNEELCIRIARELSSQDSPQTLELLQKWSESENPRLAKAAGETLQGALLRERIRAESKSLFRDLATGKIQPDDLLGDVPTWIWREHQYVLANDK